MKKISGSEFDVVLKSDKPVVVDFFAEWCGPCKMLSPILDEISGERDDVDFYKIDIDTEREITEEYGIMSVPTVIKFKDGQIASKFVGLHSKEDVIDFLDS